MKNPLYLFAFLLIFSGLPLSANALTTYIGDNSAQGASVTDLGVVDGANSGALSYIFTTGAYVNNSGNAVQLDVTTVNFWADATGSVTPFVAIYNGGSLANASSFNVLAKGSAISANAGQANSAAFLVGGNTPTVTVGAGQSLVGGFYQDKGVVPYAGIGDPDFLQLNDIIPASGQPSANANWSTLTRTYSFNIAVEEPDNPLPPTGIELSNNELLPVTPGGTEVGLFNTSDPNPGDNVFTYALVSGAGSSDNALFAIAGARLETGGTTGGAGSTYSIRIRSTDPGGLSFEKIFTISVIAGQPPTAIELSAGVISADAPAGSTVGLLSTIDPDLTDIHTYTFATGAGDDDNAAFTISGSQLKLMAAAPVSGTSLSVRIRSTDRGSFSIEASFPIIVVDPSVRISEFMASNNSTLLDEDGDSSDWIEIFNEQSEAVNLSGWYLTDDAGDLTKWQFPSRVIPGGGYLLVFASSKNRADAGDPELHTNFNLSSSGDFLALVKPDGQTVASLFSPAYPAQTSDISYGVSADASVTGFFALPTPGSANGTPSPAGINKVEFSVKRGFYETAFSVTLSPSIPGSTIRFTTNGTKPTSTTGTVYSTPINITGTTTLRAVSYTAGGPMSVASTHTYVFVSDVATQGVMSTAITNHPVWGPQMKDSLLEIPSVSLVMSGNVSQTESETSMEMIFPDGSSGFQIDCGVEHFGGHSINSPKKNMRMSFKKAYGASRLNFDLYGGDAAKEFDQIILRTGSHDNWFWTHPSGHGGVFVRGRWAFDRQLESGNPAPRGRWVHVYINGVYHGMHHLMERPNAAFMASYLGGVKEDYEALNAGTPIDGDKSTWNAMKAVLGNYEQLKSYMDVQNYADYMLLQFYGGNDWDWNTSQNWASASRKAPNASYKFFAWDSDVILRTTLNANVVERGGPENLWATVKAHPEFRLLLADRAQKFFFRDGMLTRDRVLAQMDELTAIVEKPVIAETARWGNGSWTPATWQGEVNEMKNDLIDQRTGVVISQMRAAGVFPAFDAPVFSQFGGSVPAAFSLSLSLPANASGGEIFYTMDGSDPSEGALPPSTTETILLNQGIAAKAFIPSLANGGDTLGNSWKGGSEPFSDGSWLSGTSGIGYDASSDYQSLIGLNLIAMQNQNASAFARIAFTLTQQQLDDMDELRLDMKAEDGFVAYLNGMEVASLQEPASLAWNSSSAGATDDSIALQFQPHNLTPHIGELNVGPNILAFHILNQGNTNSDLLCLPRLIGLKFPEGGNEGAPGGALYSGPLALSTSGTVRARVKLNGEWSALEESFFYVDAVAPAPGDLLVSEIYYNPHETAEAEFIEIKNTSAKNLILDGVKFVDGIAFTFPANTVLAAGKHIVVNSFSGSLSNGGEALRLVDANGTELLNFSYSDSGSWPGRADGKGSSAELENPAAAPATQPALNAFLANGGNWRASSEFHGSPGSAGSGPDNRIIFNEILAHTDLPEVDRFELFNQSGSSIDVSGWFISDDSGEYKKFEIAGGTTLAAGMFLTFDESHFNAGNSLIDFALSSASGDDLYLLETDGAGNLLRFVDRATFGASANGESFGRWPDGTGGFYPMQATSFGQLNNTGGNSVRVGPVIISEVMYNPAADPDTGLEFVEICNAGTLTENLANWRLRGEADFDFTAENLAPAAVLVIVSFDPVTDTVSRDTFLSAYPSATASQLRGPWSAGTGNLLDNDGAPIRLQRPDALESPPGETAFYPALFEDTVTYDDIAPWPVAADGTGPSLTRISPDVYGDDPGNWQADAATPGSHPASGLTYESWAASEGLGAGPLAQPLADFDSDGTSNFIEFAIGANPSAPDPGKLPAAAFQSLEVLGQTNNYLTLSYRKRNDAPQLTYTVQVSDDLETWTPANNTVGPPVNNRDGTDTITIRDNQPVNSRTIRFIRLMVSGS